MTRFLLCFLAAETAAILCGAEPSLDVYEPVTGPTRVVEQAEERALLLHTLETVREHYALQRAGRPFDLKTSFHVNSGGRTSYDGDWQMEDMYQPGVGFRWGAETKGYSVLEISSQSGMFQSGARGPIPLRLHEARVHLMGPMMSADSMEHAAMRTASAMLSGTKLTCLLFSNSRTGPHSEEGRRWDDMEECIDPQTGLLRIHSPVAGLYVIYDYTRALTFAECILPETVTVMEGGKAVIQEHVKSLTEPENVNALLFVPSEEMRSNGPGTKLVSLRRMNISVKPESAVALEAQPVIVFGLLTTTGEISDAHVLQQCDSVLSQAAISEVKKLRMARSPDNDPRQRHLFIRVNFSAS